MPDELALTQRQLRAAQTGDRPALEALFARYLPRVRAMAAARIGRTLRQMTDIDDLVQETMRDALLGLERIDTGSNGLFAHWLARCVENNVRDALRHNGAARRGRGTARRFADLDQTLSESLFPGRELAASELAREREMEERIERTLLRMGARYRDVLVLRARGGLDYREIAAVMDLPSENTANVLFLRARKRLAELLGPDAAR